MKYHSQFWRISLYAVVWISLLSACTEQIPIPGLNDQFNQLVVEANFTNENRIQAIYLSRSVSLANGSFPKETGATIYITDSKNNRIDFQESQPGVYLTSANTNGNIAETYTLHIVTADGNIYESSPEQMPKAPPLIKNTELTREVDITGENGPPGSVLVTVEMIFDDPAGEMNYYRWVWRSNEQNQFGLPDTTWRTLVANDVLFDGNEASITLDQTFNPDFDGFVKVYQTAINAAAYDFLLTIQNQVDSGLQAFLPPGPPIEGNIVNKNNSSEKVLGYFVVAGVTSDTIRIDP